MRNENGQMEKTLSFIVAAYNAERYLRTCLDSFLVPESFSDIEVLVIDDGSTDGTAAIAAEYQEKYPEVIRLVSKENGGHGSVINVGSKLAAGRYMRVVDADDWVVSGNLTALTGKLKHCAADVILTHYHTVDMATGKKTGYEIRLGEYERDYSMDELVKNWPAAENTMTFHGVIYRLDFYRSCGIELSEHIFYEDQEYVTIPCSRAGTFCPIDLYLYEYLIGNSEQSVDARNQLKRIGHTEQVIWTLIEDYNTHPEFSDAVKWFYYRKTEIVVLNFYVTSLLVDADRKAGRRRGGEFSLKLRKSCPEFYGKVYKKYRFFMMLNALGIGYPLYQKAIKANFYRALRRKKDA